MGDCGKLGECCVGSAEKFDPVGVGVLEGGTGELCGKGPRRQSTFVIARATGSRSSSGTAGRWGISTWGKMGLVCGRESEERMITERMRTVGPADGHG
jgi:hypothetical protein